MKIAIFTDTFLPQINGVVTSIVNSSTRLANQGNKILIFTSQSKDKRKIFLHKNIHIIHYKPINLINYPDFQLTSPNPMILREIQKFKPDIIHSHMPSFLGWEAVICSKLFNIPLIGTYHTLITDFTKHFKLFKNIKNEDLIKRIVWKYTKMYYNRCDLITTPSIAMKNELLKHGIKRPIHFISNGVDLKRFYPKKYKKNDKTILHVGRISYEKNIDVLIKSFKIVLKKHPDSKLLIVGKGPSVNKLKKEAGSNNIKFLGPILHEKLINIYAKADIFVTASTVETEGLVVLEAMACALPIVAVDALAIPYIVKHNKNGFLAKPNNENEIAFYINKLLENKELRTKFGKGSLSIVKQFSLDTIINQMKKLYNSLIK